MRRPKGYALAVVIILSTVALTLWASVHRTATQAVRVKKVHTLRNDRDSGVAQAVLHGLHYLEHNVPKNGHSYLTSAVVAGETRTYRVRFRLLATSGLTRRWNVSAERVS